MMEFAALGFLMFRPLSMYELQKAMARTTRHFLSASFGSLHPTLRKLEKLGYVTSDSQVSNGRNRKVYAITEAGRAHVVSWLGQDVAMEKVSDPSLLRLFFLGHLAPEERAEVLGRFLSQVQQAGEALSRLHDEVAGKPAPAGFEDHVAYQVATLEFGIAYHRFVGEWYQAKLASMGSAGVPGGGEARPAGDHGGDDTERKVVRSDTVSG